MTALFAALPEADPRLRLLIELAAELRAGQAVRATRSELVLGPVGRFGLGPFVVQGRRKKHNEVVYLHPELRAVTDEVCRLGICRRRQRRSGEGISRSTTFSGWRPARRKGEAGPVPAVTPGSDGDSRDVPEARGAGGVRETYPRISPPTQESEKPRRRKRHQGLHLTKSGRRDLNPRPPEPHRDTPACPAVKVREFSGFCGHGIDGVVKPLRVFGGSTHRPHRPDDVRPHAGPDLPRRAILTFRRISPNPGSVVSLVPPPSDPCPARHRRGPRDRPRVGKLKSLT
jgi:hypothetical protein